MKSGIRRLMHSMAIETGVIEGLYNPDHSVTQTLLRKGLESNLCLARASTWNRSTWLPS